MNAMGGQGRDLYGVLGVSADADADALRTAYRELARQTSILNEIVGTPPDADSQHGDIR